MIFRNNSISLGRDSAFSSHEMIPDSIIAESFFEEADVIVYNAMMDSMCATYQGVCANSPEIIREGLGDMAKSAWEFFKNILKKIADFIKNSFNYLMSYVLDFDKFIEKYKDNSSKFKEFEVQGYEYTIDKTEIDTGAIEKLVSDYNSTVGNIRKMEMGEIQKIIADAKSDDYIGKVRSAIVGNDGGHIKSDKFDEALRKSFHNGKSSKSTIKVNPSNIDEIISDFRNYKEMIDDVKEEGHKIESVCSDLADFFKGMPQYEYKSSDSKKINNYSLSVDTKAGTVKDEKTSEEDYDTDYYKKLSAYYNFCFRTTKDIMAIYTKAFTTKVGVLKEAINFHKGCIRRALSPFGDKEEESAKESFIEVESFPINSEENTEYSSMFENLYYRTEYDVYFEHFNQYINEIEVLGEAYHRGMIMLEDVEINDRDANTNEKTGFFQSIIDFIKKTINSFINAAKNLFNNNKEWFAENRHKFDELTEDGYSKLKITIVPYEKVFKYEVPKVGMQIDDKRIGTKGFQSITELAPYMYPNQTKLSMSKDIVEGSKIFYRGGSNNLVKYESGAVKPLVTQMLEYCEKYVDIANGIKDDIDKVTKVMEEQQEKNTKEEDAENAAENAEANKTTNESSSQYSIAEGMLISESVFGLFPWVDSEGKSMFIVRESKKNKNKQQQQEQQPNPAEPAVTADGTDPPKEQPKTDAEKAKAEEEKKKAEEAKKKQKEENSARRKAKLEYCRVTVKVATAMLTIAEERYVKYIKTLKAVLAAAKVTSKKDPVEEKK